MAATLRLYSFLSAFAVIYSFHLFVVWLTEASNGGFTVDLIQRDSALSLSYNQSHTYYDRLHNAFHRSISRVNRFKTSSLQSIIIASDGEYLMKVSIGTPPVEVLGIADTGSDLTWTQCKPCKKCYKQNSSLFDPDQSLTYHVIGCKSGACTALEKASCGSGACKYSYSYGDLSFTKGNLAVETLTIGSVSIPNIVFGCGHHNRGTFAESGSGIIGLGDGSFSLISQLNKSIGGKFSYCLSQNTTSKISFGENAVVSSSSAVAETPLVAKEPTTFYYLTLEAISVGIKRFVYKGSSAEEGKIIIDLGTTLTFLPPKLHADLVMALEEAIDAEVVSDPMNVLSLCFRSEVDIDVPIITAHFAGADLKLQTFNTFVRVEDDAVCFSMVPSEDVAIYGNLAQMNFLVGYDLEGKKMSFLPTDYTSDKGEFSINP
ncbi:aspartic proteinase CDR1-like [Corylus avellana]|uniref:aspartic proteinase CDR1-like n=1 Tax=Corylus avellana TaxID=13451 RepID=UPI001E207D6B|nr:aspartic proteinase CDR1-like [Corylus avellana]